MPTLNAHQSNDYTKLLIEGDSGTGKTGALASLVSAGYSLRILDFDNGLDVLKAFVERDDPASLARVEFRTLRDKRRATSDGPAISGTPKAYVEAIKMLDRWKYTDDGVETDLGIPAEWGPDCILVLDSLTRLSDAAWDFREPLAPRGKDGKYDQRSIYKDAQNAIENNLALLTSESFRTNVIVISHIRYMENEDGTKKAYPTSVGTALGPIIPSYFNSVAQCITKGGKRTIQTMATSQIDLKNPKPFAMAASYPIETGLAQFFEVLRGPLQAPTKPKSLTLKRVI